MVEFRYRVPPPRLEIKAHAGKKSFAGTAVGRGGWGCRLGSDGSYWHGKPVRFLRSLARWRLRSVNCRGGLGPAAQFICE